MSVSLVSDRFFKKLKAPGLKQTQFASERFDLFSARVALQCFALFALFARDLLIISENV